MEDYHKIYNLHITAVILPLGRYILYILCTGRLFGDLMGTIGRLFPLTDNTNGTAVDQVQQQHFFISKLHRFNK
jgi:hypothetical protein